MKARPILFSGSMIRALLDGTKTQTRRAVKPQPPSNVRDAGVINSGNPEANGTWLWLDHLDLDCASQVGDDFRCPYGVPGDLLWAREAWTLVPATAYRMSEGVQQTVSPQDPHDAAIYCAGWDRSIPKWRPSIHMPRWASRLTLDVADVRIERLTAISDADALAEGIIAVAPPSRDGMRHFGVPGMAIDAPTPARAYLALWAAINGQASADADPWVWAVTFDVQRRNVDAVLADAAPATAPPAPITESQA